MMRRTVAAAIIGAMLLFAPMTARTQVDNSNVYEQLNLFGQVFERVRSDYVEEVEEQELIESAIRGMLNALDPHSSYLDAKNFRNMRVQTKGEFGGLGIEVTMENGFVKVVSPIDDTPAHRAGVKAGDLITHLDGDPVLGLTLNEAVERMRGKVSTDIELTIRRNGQQPFEVTITRDVIKIQSVRSRLEGTIGYVRITTFNEQTISGLQSAVGKFRKELGDDIIGIVLDLRNNPGGLLEQAIAVSDAFLNKGEIVSTRGRRIEDANRYNARPGDIAGELPLIVLINEGSASASEIVAGALQDHNRAVLMGTKTFGKGSVQTIVPLGAHGAIKLTTQRYYTPSGRSIQAKGIEPDIVVEQARIELLDAPQRGREADLRGALENVGATTEESDAPDAETPTASDAPQDYQLARALDLIRGLSLFSERIVN